MPFLMVKAGRSLNSSKSSNREGLDPSNRSTSEPAENDATFHPSVTNNYSSADSVMADNFSSDDQLGNLSVMEVDEDEGENINREQASIACDVKMSTDQATKINHRNHSRSPSHELQKNPQASSIHSDRTKKYRIPLMQDLKPQALCLTVQLSKKSFLPNPYPHEMKLRALDVKIDIYYNGELCTSCYVPERLRSDSSIAELTQRFGGRRVDRLLERPWIIVPSGQNANGTLREHRRGKGGDTGALQRWKAVSHILEGEAERGGRNKWGDLSVLGDYLKTLSMLEMPREVEDLQKGGGVRYGIIDVVLTAGHGKKDNPESGYLSEPARMRISELKKSRSETMLKAPKSPAVLQGDQSRATSTGKQRAKVFADAEIISSGFYSLAPRRQSSTLSTITLQKPSDVFSSAPQVVQKGVTFPAPSAPSTAPSAARRRQSGLGHVATACETPTLTPPIANRLATPQLGNLQPPRPSYRGSGPASSPALSNYSNEKDTVTPRSVWKDFLVNAGHQSLSSTCQGAGYYATNLMVGTGLQSHRNASQQHRQPSQSCISRTTRAPVSTVQARPQHIAQKRFKGPDRETQGEGQRKQEKQKGKEQWRYTQVAADGLTGTEDPKKKRSRMGYINVLTTKLTEAEEIEAIQQVVIDELAARDGDTTKNTTKPEPYTSPLTRRSRTSELPSEPSAYTSAPDPPAYHILPGPAPGQPLKHTRSHSQLAPDVRHPLVLSLSPRLLSSIRTRPHTPAPHASPQGSASLSPLSSRSPELPDPVPAPTRRRVHAIPKSRRKPAPSATMPATQWQPSALSDNCVVAYAPGKVRQVKAERTGWFKEASLLCGVRFVVV